MATFMRNSGVPAGGTATQALTKIDGTNYSTQWTTLRPIPLLTVGRPTSWFRTSMSVTTTGITPTLNTLYLTPIFVDTTVTVQTLSALTVTVTTGGYARLGIYAGGAYGEPETLVLDAGIVAFSTNNTANQITGLSQVLTPGIYWLGFVMQLGTSSWASGSAINGPGFFCTQRTQNGNGLNLNGSWSVASVTGALPATISPSPASTAIVTWMRTT